MVTGNTLMDDEAKQRVFEEGFRRGWEAYKQDPMPTTPIFYSDWLALHNDLYGPVLDEILRCSGGVPDHQACYICGSIMDSSSIKCSRGAAPAAFLWHKPLDQRWVTASRKHVLNLLPSNEVAWWKDNHMCSECSEESKGVEAFSIRAK